MKVFLGGTCNESTWRAHLIPELEEAGIEYFNPVREDYGREHQEEEIRQREEACDVLLYVLTPEIAGYLSIAEAVEDSIKRPAKTVFSVCQEVNMHADGGGVTTLEFSESQWRSLQAVGAMVTRNGAQFVAFGDIVSACRKVEPTMSGNCCSVRVD